MFTSEITLIIDLLIKADPGLNNNNNNHFKEINHFILSTYQTILSKRCIIGLSSNPITLIEWKKLRNITKSGYSIKRHVLITLNFMDSERGEGRGKRSISRMREQCYLCKIDAINNVHFEFRQISRRQGKNMDRCFIIIVIVIQDPLSCAFLYSLQIE